MRVIHYYPRGYCYPVTSGPDSVACNQLNYFRAAGFEVDCVFSNLAHKAWAADQFREKFGWVNSVTHLDLPFDLPWRLRDLLFVYERARKNRAFQSLWSRPADLFFTNYIFTAPLALEAPQSCRRVVEMLDLLSIAFTQDEIREAGSTTNKALADARQRLLFDLELDLCQVFDRVIMVSANEFAAVHPHLGNRTVLIPPFVPDPGVPPESDTEEPDHLLFVGSSYSPNVIGLDWFYRRVYLPYLHKVGVRLTVVGSVCDYVSFNDGCLVTKLPRAEGPLIDVYRRARLVIVPLFEGTGVSIKTIESFAMGCATLTTPVGARGMPRTTDAVAELDIPANPAGAAEVVRDLLASPQRLSALRMAARRFYEQHFHPDRYRARMDHALGMN